MITTNINISSTTQIKHQLANEIVDYKNSNPQANGYLAIKDGKFVLVSKRSFLFNLSSIRQAALCLRKAEITPSNRFYVSFAEAFSGSTRLFGSEMQQKLLESAKSTIRVERLLTNKNIRYVLCSNLEEANKSENANKIVLWASTSDINKITIYIPGKKPQRVGSEREIIDVINPYLLDISLQQAISQDTLPKTAFRSVNLKININTTQSASFSSDWNDLKNYAREMKNQDWEAPKFNSFNDVRSYPNTRVHPDLNANLVNIQNGSKIIAASYPTVEALPTYLNMLREKSPSVMFVLTENKEIQGKFTPYFKPPLSSSQVDNSASPIYKSHGDLQIKAIHVPNKNTLEGLSAHQYELTISKNGTESRTIPVVHVTDWADFSGGNGAHALMQLALTVDKFGGTPLIHCRAGVGRTGTLIVARMMLEQRKSGQAITREGVINCIKEVRAQRNEMMVQTEEQLNILFELVDLLNAKAAA